MIEIVINSPSTPLEYSVDAFGRCFCRDGRADGSNDEDTESFNRPSITRITGNDMVRPVAVPPLWA